MNNRTLGHTKGVAVLYHRDGTPKRISYEHHALFDDFGEISHIVTTGYGLDLEVGVIEVTDIGSGIEPDSHSRVFDTFSCTESAVATV